MIIMINIMILSNQFLYLFLNIAKYKYTMSCLKPVPKVNG